MTREEAIERLKQNKAAAKFYAGMTQNTNAIENELKDIEALDMAIQALSNADRPTEWIPFTKSPLTDEEKEEYPDWIYILDCPLPDDGQEILLSNGKYVWTDTFSMMMGATSMVVTILTKGWHGCLCQNHTRQKVRMRNEGAISY